MVVAKTVDGLPDARDYDLIGFGRGALGAAVDTFKQALQARNPKLIFVDTIVPTAVRQIEAA
jgi:hypothetical protein